jgi:hypothetical protein
VFVLFKLEMTGGERTRKSEINRSIVADAKDELQNVKGFPSRPPTFYFLFFPPLSYD